MNASLAPLPVVCFGDSLTEGGPHPEADRWTYRLQRLLDGSYPGGFVVHNRGVAGNTSANGLDRISETVLPLLPGRVLVAFGTNDCNVRPDRRTPRVGVEEFAANLGEIVRMVRAAGGEPCLLSPHPPGPDARDAATRKYDQGNGLSYAENFRPYHAAILRVARQDATPLVDLPAAMDAAAGEAAGFVADDGVHLTVAGHRFYAAEIHRRLFA